MFKLCQKTVKMLGARCLSQPSVTKPPSIISSKFVTEFNTFYPKLIDRVLSNVKYMEHEEVRKRIKTVAEEYPLIKIPNQGEFMLFVYELLEKPENLTENKIYQGYVLAALQEIFQVYFIIEDDVLDQSETRNQKTCWYLIPGASNLAINDISLCRSIHFEVLKQNFDENLFLKIVDLAQEGFLRMEMSQHLDAITKDFKNFTFDVYNLTQMTKAAEYSILAPIKMALVLSNQANEKSFKLAEDLCYDLGVMVQINNDYTEYLDYRKPFTMKSGTDIKKKVCSWPAVAALQHFNPEQRKIFEENYGKWDSECEKRIVKLYDEVNLDKLYFQERDSRYKRYLKKVEELPSDSVPSPHVFRQILQFYRSTADDTERVPPQKTATSIAPRFANEFNTFYPALVDTVLCNTKYMNNVMEPQEQIKAIAKGYLMKNRRQSEFLLYVYELLEKPENINEKKIYQGYVLASLLEMIQTFFMIENDVLHKAKTRDQKPCWYLLPNANRLGLNDIYLFRSFMNEMIKQNIDQSIFTKIMDLTNEIYLNMETSLHLDFYTIDLNNLTIDVYDRLRMTAGYSKIASIKMALVLCNKATEESFKLVEDLCGDLGLMVQINNDFTDYMNYKNSVIRKSGTHIKKRLCTWPSVAALQHFNTEQRGIFEENYGKWDNESEKRIIKLYDDINLEKLYLKEKESRYKRYLSKVNKLPSDAVPSAHVFRQILNFQKSFADD